MRTGLFITARLKSTRLPRKVLAEISGKPVLEHLIGRVKRARGIDQFVLCTSTLAEDDPIEEIGERLGILVFRGAADDVLVRYRDACLRYGVDFFAVTWGDEPLCEPQYIERVVKAGTQGGTDFVYVEGLPTGTYTYGVRTTALQRVCQEKADEDTEVWGRYFTNNPVYHKVKLTADQRHQRTNVRLTLDYSEDLLVLSEIFRILGEGERYFTLDDVLAFLDLHPELTAINSWLEDPYRRRIEGQARERLKDG